MDAIFQDPNNQINNQGMSEYNIPHILKIQATHVFPPDFSLSLYYNYPSGPAWTRTLVIPGFNQGAAYVPAEERGSRRYPAANNLDLRLKKSFYRNNFRLSLMPDVFNQGDKTWAYLYAGDDFGKTTDVKPPRSTSAGVRFWF
jgi:hypothetical protein